MATSTLRWPSFGESASSLPGPATLSHRAADSVVALPLPAAEGLPGPPPDSSRAPGAVPSPASACPAAPAGPPPSFSPARPPLHTGLVWAWSPRSIGFSLPPDCRPLALSSPWPLRDARACILAAFVAFIAHALLRPGRAASLPSGHVPRGCRIAPGLGRASTAVASIDRDDDEVDSTPPFAVSPSRRPRPARCSETLRPAMTLLRMTDHCPRRWSVRHQSACGRQLTPLPSIHLLPLARHMFRVARASSSLPSSGASTSSLLWTHMGQPVVGGLARAANRAGELLCCGCLKQWQQDPTIYCDYEENFLACIRCQSESPPSSPPLLPSPASVARRVPPSNDSTAPTTALASCP